MSSSKLIEWIDNLLFGSMQYTSTPIELRTLELKLHIKGVSVSETIRNGGLVNSIYLVSGDLDQLIEHFQNHSTIEPSFRTGLVTRTYNHLAVTLARRSESTPTFRTDQEDSEILNSILRGDTAEYNYKCPRFWGNLATRLLNDRRPFPGLMRLDRSIPDPYVKNAIRLFDVTVKTLGKLVDPLEMYLVSRSEYVDPIHFGSANALESFLSIHPDHIVTKTLIDFIRCRIVDRILNGRNIQIHHPGLESFMENLLLVHGRIVRVSSSDEPPRLVDVFQRLLALCQHDHLWQNDPHEHHEESNESPSTIVWTLTEKLDRVERQNAFLLSHLESH